MLESKLTFLNIIYPAISQDWYIQNDAIDLISTSNPTA